MSGAAKGSARPGPGVSEATEVSDELVSAFASLVPQLSSSAPPPGHDELAEMVRAPSTTVLVARSADGVIVGTLTLVVFRIPTGVRAWIEDVVVDASSRGTGMAPALVREAIRRAEAAGARTVDLTSRPSRQAANRLYQKLGFDTRSTNVFRFTMPEGPS